MQHLRGSYSDEPILERARQGLPLGELVIDAHGHLGSVPLLYVPRTDAASLVEVMDRCGVCAVAISSMLSVGPDYQAGNRHVAAAADAFPGRFIGYATVNPNYPAEECEAELEYWLTKHHWMRGIKLHPVLHQYQVTGAGYRIAFEVAARYRVPVLSHTWGEDPDAKLCGPALFGELAEAYPSVPILLGHSGGILRGYRSAVSIAQRYPNIYLETCGSFQAMGLIEYLVSMVGAHRVLFGTDVCYLSQTAGLGRVVYARISTEEKRRILGQNAAELFHYDFGGLPEPRV